MFGRHEIWFYVLLNASISLGGPADNDVTKYVFDLVQADIAW